MNDKTAIESAEIVKQARIPAVSRERAKSRSDEAAIKIIFRSRWALPYESIQVVAIEVERERPEVAMAEHRGIQLIAHRVIETFGQIPIRVLNLSVYAQDRADNRITLNQVRK